MLWSGLQQLNAFLEDTCVLVTLAYLLSRGRLLPTLFDRQRRRADQWALAAVFGLAGASDLLFPGDRRPYVLPTLAAGLAGYAGGPRLGLASAGLTLALSLPRLLLGPHALSAVPYGVSVLSAAGLGTGLARIWAPPGRERPRSAARMLAGAFLTGAGAEALHAAWQAAFGAAPTSIASVLADGFGALLLALVLHDAHERREAARRLIDSERELAASRLSQLNQLQARLHPHFLFNALAAIAGLCVVSPAQAERAVTTLAGLLRRFLRAPADDWVPLREELALVRAYLDIERLRLGDRLCVEEEVPPETLDRPVPRFCLQIPVENAVGHGLAPAPRPGMLRLVVRPRGPRGLTLAVLDNGLGATPRGFGPDAHAGLTDPTPHGLTLLWMRLCLSRGPRARMRLSSRPGRGTVFVLRLPPGGHP